MEYEKTGSRRVEPVTYPPTECLNRGFWPPWKGSSDCLEHRASLFCYEKLAERNTESFAVKCLDVFAGEVDILCYSFSFLCLLKANCNFQKRGLKDFVQHSITVAEVDSRTIFVPF